MIVKHVQQMHSANGTRVWDTPRVMPFGAWLSKLWSDLQLRGATQTLLLSGEQERKVWEQVLISSREDTGFLASAQQAWTLAARYQIPLTSSAMSATTETRKFFTWARDFARRCSDNNWTTQAQLADELVPLVTSTELPTEVVLYGFDQLVPQQRMFIERLQVAGCAVEEIAVPHADPSGSCLFSAEDEKAELRAAARWARAQLEHDPAVRVGVVVLGLGDSRLLVEQVFTEVLHPERAFGQIGERAFELSLGTPLSDQPMVHAALQQLELCIGEVEWRTVSSLSRSPYVGGYSREWAQRAKFDLCLREVLPVRLTLRRLLRLMSSEEIAPEIQSRLRAAFEALETEQASFRRMSQWREVAKSILRAAGWPGDRSLNSAEYQASQRWRELLSEVAALDVVTGEVPFTDFVKELRRAAQSVIFKPESTEAPVQIMDAREVAGAVFDALWICGATDEVLPSPTRPNPFLPLALQQQAGVPSANSELQRKNAGETLRRLTASASEIVFSAPRQEGDRKLRRSALLDGVHAVTEAALLLSSDNDVLVSQRGAALSLRLETNAPSVDASERTSGGTTLLKHQSNCPFRAFAEIRLGARKLDEPAEGLTPIDRGELVERVLECVWTELKDSATLMSADLGSIIECAISKTFATWPAPPDARTRAHLEIERERLRAVVTEWLELEKRREIPFRVIMQQQDLQLELAGRTIKGRADRVDRVDGGVIVIDYKTGSSAQGPAQWRVPRIELPQLPFYAAQLMSQGEPVLGVAFARVRRGEPRFSGYAATKGLLPFGRDMVKAHADGDYNAHIAKWHPALEQLQRDFLSGEAAVNPLHWPSEGNSTCAQCDLQPLCRVGELSPSAREDDEEDADE
jgi:probable DNA repair protein